MVRRSPHVEIFGDFGEVVLFVWRNGEISNDCDFIVFGLLVGLGLEDDVVESKRRTVRIRRHGES